MIAQHAVEESLMDLPPVTTESKEETDRPDSQVLELVPLPGYASFEDFGYEMGPVFWPPTNTLWIEWIYIIDLDRKLFSVGSHDSRGHHHFKLDEIPEDWIELLERARTEKIVLNQTAASYPKPEPDQSLLELYKRSNPTIFQISLTSSFIHEPTYMSLVDCLTTQMNGYRSYDYFKFLDEWGPDDPQFKKLAFTMLRLCSNCAADFDPTISQPIRFECAYPSTSTFWLHGVLIVFETHLDHTWSSQNLKAAVAKVIRAGQKSSRTSFTALLFSIRHVVVVEVGSSSVKHTLPIPVLDELRKPDDLRYSNLGLRTLLVVLCRGRAESAMEFEGKREVLAIQDGKHDSTAETSMVVYVE